MLDADIVEVSENEAKLAVAKSTQIDTEALQKVLISGDLSKLSTEQELQYYSAVCNAVGINPLTKPFDYIILQGRKTLYANKSCAEQLRKIYKISVENMETNEIGGVLIVKVKVKDLLGRTDISSGAVNIANLKGDMLANAIMKAETKAKRRATLSICGLTMLDETEIETIKEVQKTYGSFPKETQEIEAKPLNFREYLLSNGIDKKDFVEFSKFAKIKTAKDTQVLLNDLEKLDSLITEFKAKDEK